MVAARLLLAGFGRRQARAERAGAEAALALAVLEWARTQQVDLLSGTISLATDTLKIALYTSNASLDADTTAYTASNEVVGTGYTAGGQVLTGVAVAASNGIAYLTFANPTWTGPLTARGALIYDSSVSNKAVAVLDFGADKTASPFTITLPVADSANALLRFA